MADAIDNDFFATFIAPVIKTRLEQYVEQHSSSIDVDVLMSYLCGKTKKTSTIKNAPVTINHATRGATPVISIKQPAKTSKASVSTASVPDERRCVFIGKFKKQCINERHEEQPFCLVCVATENANSQIDKLESEGRLDEDGNLIVESVITKPSVSIPSKVPLKETITKTPLGINNVPPAARQQVKLPVTVKLPITSISAKPPVVTTPKPVPPPAAAPTVRAAPVPKISAKPAPPTNKPITATPLEGSDSLFVENENNFVLSRNGEDNYNVVGVYSPEDENNMRPLTQEEKDVAIKRDFTLPKETEDGEMVDVVTTEETAQENGEDEEVSESAQADDDEVSSEVMSVDPQMTEDAPVKAVMPSLGIKGRPMLTSFKPSTVKLSLPNAPIRVNTKIIS